jgi:hypothetical protein
VVVITAAAFLTIAVGGAPAIAIVKFDRRILRASAGTRAGEPIPAEGAERMEKAPASPSRLNETAPGDTPETGPGEAAN